MIRVTVTLDDSHKVSDGYIFMFGDDRIYTTQSTFVFELESDKDLCNVIQSKIGKIKYKILKFNHTK